MKMRLEFSIAMCVTLSFGCHPATEPGPISTATHLLSFQTDSTRYSMQDSTINVRYHIHNGTDSTVIFLACCNISLRADQLQDSTWVYGDPLWGRPCPALCSSMVSLEANDLYTGYFLLKKTATYRLVAIYSISGEAGWLNDTLVSNSFDIR